MTDTTSALIWRDYETDGVPATGPHDPVKADIRGWGANVERPLFDTIAQAAATTIPLTRNVVLVGGRSAFGDGGGAHWVRRSSAPSHAQYWTDASGAFFELDEPEPDVAMCGAVEGGIVDASAAFASAVAYAAAKNYPAIYVSPGKAYLIDSNLTVSDGISIVGPYKFPQFPGLNYSIDWTQVASRLYINSAASITLNGGSGLIGCSVFRKGIVLPAPNASAFAGTAIKLATAKDNQVIRNCMIAGFSIGVYTNASRTSGGTNRYTLDTLWMDNNSNLDLDTSYDVARIINIHGWPFTTIEAYAAGGSISLLTRPGTGIKIRNNADGTYFGGMTLMLGYFTGIDAASTGAITADSLWLEGESVAGSAAFRLGANTTRIFVKMLWCWAYEQGIVQNSNAGEHLSIAQAYFENITQHAITVIGGDLSIDWAIFKSIGARDLNITSAASKIHVRGKSTLNGAPENVAVPAGGVPENLDIMLDTDRAAGSALFGVNPMAFTQVASAGVMLLPMKGDTFAISGGAAINTISNIWGGRRIRLVMLSTATLTLAGNILLANGVPTIGLANQYFDFVYDATQGKLVETGRGPQPAPTVFLSAKNFGAAGSTQSTTGSINSGSSSLTLTAVLDFQNGQGIEVLHAGPAFAINPPTGLTVTPQGATGAATRFYTVCALNAKGGVGAALASVSISNSNASPTATNYNNIQWTAPASGTAPTGYAIYGGASAGTMALLGITNGTSFADFGSGTLSTPPIWLPSAPQVSALASNLITSIISGAGTTTLVLANTAGTTVATVGVYHDDTAAVQAALNAIAAIGSGCLFFPDGQYNLGTSTLTYSGQNLRITGNGISSKIVKIFEFGDLFRFSGQNGFNIDNLNVLGGFNGGTGYMFRWTNTSSAGGDIWIQDLFFTGGANLFEFLGGQEIFISRIKGQFFFGQGFHFGASMLGLVFMTDVYLAGLPFGSPGAAGNAGNGIIVENGDSYMLSNVQINNMQISYNFTTVAAGFITDVFCQNCFSDQVTRTQNNNSSSGWVFDGSAAGALMGRSVLDACWSGSSGGFGMLIKGVKDLTLNACLVKGNALNGIYITGAASKGIKIRNSTIEFNSQVPNNTYDGINIDASGSSNLDISGNRVGPSEWATSTQRFGINLATANLSNVLMLGNDVTGNATGSIGDSSTATSNRIKDNLGYNPLGVVGRTPSASPDTYTAGHTSETVYLSATTSIASVTVGGVALNTVAVGANVMFTVHLEPNEVMVTTYTGTLTFRRHMH